MRGAWRVLGSLCPMQLHPLLAMVLLLSLGR